MDFNQIARNMATVVGDLGPIERPDWQLRAWEIEREVSNQIKQIRCLATAHDPSPKPPIREFLGIPFLSVNEKSHLNVTRKEKR